MNNENLAMLIEEAIATSPKVAVIQVDLAVLQQDVAVLKEDVAVLKEDVAVLKEDVAVLKEDVAVLKEDVAVLKEDVADLKEDVAVLKQEVKVLQIVQHKQGILMEHMDHKLDMILEILIPNVKKCEKIDPLIEQVEHNETSLHDLELVVKHHIQDKEKHKS